MFRQARSDLILIRNNVTEEIILDMIVVTSFLGLVGARLFYVALHFEAFGFDILKWTLFTYFPGLSLLGAIVVSLAFLILITRTRKLPTLVMMDFATIGFLTASPFGLLGSFLAEKVSRFPVHLIEAMMMTALLGMFLYTKKKGIIRKDGIISLTFLSVFAIVTFGFEFIRDDRIFWGFLTFNQWASLILGMVALSALIKIKKDSVIPFLQKYKLLW